MSELPVSVIIPVLHEADIINRTIHHIRSIDGGKRVELIVVDGARETDTLSAIEDPDVIKISSKTGRGVQMNRGVNASTGEVLLFLHADTELPQNGLMLISEALADAELSAGAFTLSFLDAPFLLRLTLSFHDLRGRLTRIPYGDQAIFVKKEAFRQIGGYRDYRIMEDADLMRRLKRAGMSIRILKDRVRTSARRFEKNGTIRTLLHILVIVGLFHVGVDPERLARRYYRTK